MSAFNILSTILTNRDAKPVVLTDNGLVAGRIIETYGAVKTGVGDSAGSTYRCVTVPSNARITTLDACGLAFGTGSNVDVAVWYPTFVPKQGANFLTASSNSSLISSSTFAVNVAGSATTQGYTDLMYGNSSGITPDVLEQPLWQLLGLTADPEIPFDVGLSVRTTVTLSGYIGLRARYAI